MKVKDLINKLSKLPNQEVKVYMTVDGSGTVSPVELVREEDFEKDQGEIFSATKAGKNTFKGVVIW